MKLDFLILADAGQVAESKLYLQGAGITRLNVPGVPVATSLAVVVRFLVEAGDLDRQWEGSLEWVTPGGESGPAVGGVLPVSAPTGGVAEGEEHGVMIVANFPMLGFPEFGRYEVVLRLNGDLVARKPFVVGLTAPAAEAEPAP